MKKKQTFHGSDLEKIEELYGIKKEDIIPFGGNVNPLGISLRLKESMAEHLDDISEYPDRDYKDLRNSLSRYLGIPAEDIIPGNGATELIGLTFQLLCPKNALLLTPTYSEYTREISLAGGSYKEYFLREENDFRPDLENLKAHLTADVDLFAFCNPNNPTSSALSADEIREILDHCRQNHIFVMVDETYVEFAPDIQKISAVSLVPDYPNLMVLRGTSKFYAAPGLRLGYGICSDFQFREKINAIKNPWTINTLAAVSAGAMFEDEEYIRRTRELISAERTRCLDLLSGCPHLKTYPAYGNFLLIRLLDGTTSFEMFEKCIRQGMMIRDCSSFEGLDGEYIRFCIQKKEENDRLLKMLTGN